MFALETNLRTYARILCLLLLGLGIMSLSHSAQAFSPTLVVFPAPKPIGIPCLPKTTVINVVLKGNIDLADQQAGYFKVRLVDVDGVSDDTLVELKIMAGAGNPFVRGTFQTYDLHFELTCRDGCKDTMGLNSKGSYS